MKHSYSTCILAITLSGITLGVAHAQGKSADSNGRDGGSLSTRAGAAPQAEIGSASTGPISVAPSQADPSVGNDAFGGYRQLGGVAYHRYWRFDVLAVQRRHGLGPAFDQSGGRIRRSCWIGLEVLAIPSR